MNHWLILPILMPAILGAVLVIAARHDIVLSRVFSVLSAGLLLAVALVLLAMASDGSVRVYALGNWVAPFGIVLVLDRLAALMLVLTATLGLGVLLYAINGWDERGKHFHPLFQFQLMGLNGAFLTGDFFNLFVFFEILLIASYGLMVHGGGGLRVKAGVQYVVTNLVGSSVFLIAVGMIYSVTGTLNMADLALIVPKVAAADQALLQTGAVLLLLVFAVKAALVPLHFWLPGTYANAPGPVAALFAIMTKVGLYALLRLWSLLFGADAGASAQFGGLWLILGGMATMAFGAIGMMGSQRLTHLASHAAVLSSGTLLAAAGFGQDRLTAGLLYYLPSSTLAVAALFLLADLTERWRNDGATLAPYENDDDAPFLSAELVPTAGLNLDDEEQVLVGRVIPAATAFMGLAYLMSTLVIAGLPPLSGFIGKFAMLGPLLDPQGLGTAPGTSPGPAGWTLLALMIGTGLVALMALTRSGIRHFWAASERDRPQLHVLEGLPIALLLAACVVLTVQAEGVMRFTTATARALYAPAGYVRAVLNAPPRTGPGDSARPAGKEARP